MRIGHLAAAATLWATGTAATSAVLLSQGFDDVNTLAADGWVVQNLSTPLGITSWFQGNSGVFGAQSGAPASYVAANFLNAGPGGRISNWLMTPEVPLAQAATLALQVRAAGDDLLDTLEVYFSDEGASTSIADFALLGRYGSTRDEGWTALSFGVAATGGTGRFAVRYVVDDTELGGNYVGVDSLSVQSAASTVPTPGSRALAGLALAALALTTRRARRPFERQHPGAPR